MSLKKPWLAGPAVVLAALMLAGCPQGPELVVQPLALSLSSTQTTDVFRVRNGGAGTLDWQVSEAVPWLGVKRPQDAAPTASVAGNTTTGVEEIEIVVDRSQVPVGIARGEINVSGTGPA